MKTSLAVSILAASLVVEIVNMGAAVIDFPPVPLVPVLVTSFDLVWDPSPDDNVVGYRVYRGTRPWVYSGGVFAVGNVTNATIPLLANATNYFAATAVDGEGLESDLSNEVWKVGPAITNYTVFVEALSGTVKDLAIGTNAGLPGVFATNDETGSVSFDLDLPISSDYVVWPRVIAQDAGSDSFYVDVDGVSGVFHLGTNYSGAWQWVKLSSNNVPRILRLPAGPAAVAFRGREAGAWLNGFWISSRTNFVPPVATSNVVSFAVQVLVSTNAAGPFSVLTNLPVATLTNPTGSQFLRALVSVTATNL